MITILPSSQADIKACKRSAPSIKDQKGFTLLEVILALSIMSMLVGGIFAITQSILSLSQSSLTNQNNQRHSSALEGYFRTLFKDLPSTSITELTQDGLNYPALNIQSPGTFYPSSGRELQATYLTLKIVKGEDNLLSLQASWSDQDISGLDNSSEPPEMNQTLSLIDDLTNLEWEMYSTRDEEWVTTWSSELPRPSHIRLKYSTAQDQQYTHTFWIPAKQ